jgi:signal transduction histidine kinase
LYIDALNNSDADAARQRRFASAIQRQSAQLQKIIDNMLDLARLEAGRSLEVVPEPLDLQMLVQEVVQPFADTENNHQFRLDGLQPTRLVKGDPLRLAQVLRNLISNALKYSPQGGPITICSKNGEDTVSISVEDQGIGMTREQQEHLFEKFYRVANSSRTPRGSGLGLAICRLIVEGHGGRIWAQSVPGVGSTFTFSIPAVEVEEAGHRQEMPGS